MKTKDIFFYSLGIVVIIGYFAILGIKVYKGNDPTSESLMIGSLIGAFGTVVGYFFGSSSSSAKKDETISNIVQQNNTPT